MKKTPFIFLLCLVLSSCYGQAPNDKKSDIQLTGKNEPGKPLHLDITVLDINTKKPVAGVQLFVYHTNNKGDYERDANDVARIHGTVYSDQQGKLSIHTIYPRGYNDSPTGAHIHFEVKAKGYETNNNAEIMFDEYKENKYDRNNPRTSTVYIDELKDKGTSFEGKATMYVKKG